MNNPTLKKPKNDVLSELTKRIELGNKLLISEHATELERTKKKLEEDKWYAYNEKYLRACFSNASIAEDYRHARIGSHQLNARINTSENTIHNNSIYKQISKLESIIECIDIFESNSTEHPSKQRPTSRSIFIVHGHDTLLKTQVENFLHRLNLKPIILSTQANSGKTVIEKFETNAERTSFAIILLTADDYAYPKNKPNEIKDRGRQNVVLELGYFWGKLGRENICVLYDEGVELPSDLNGFVYILTNNVDSWEKKLTQEISKAGIAIDYSKLYEPETI